MADQGDKIAGKAKEVAGKVTGNDELESEGRTQKAAADTEEKIEETRDKIKGAAQGLKEKFTN